MDNDTLDALVKVSEQIVIEANKETNLVDAYCQIGSSLQTILDAVTNGYINDNVTEETDTSQRLAVLIAEQLAMMTKEKYDATYKTINM